MAALQVCVHSHNSAKPPFLTKATYVCKNIKTRLALLCSALHSAQQTCTRHEYRDLSVKFKNKKITPLIAVSIFSNIVIKFCLFFFLFLFLQQVLRITSNHTRQPKRSFFVCRHGERMDVVFGKHWLSLCSDSKG